jgi:transcriptional regulator GlxA family with amidase domain
MEAETSAPKTRFAVLALPETTPAAMYGLIEILSSVGVAWSQAVRGQPGEPLFKVEIVSADGQPFTTNAGVPVMPAQSIGSDARFDVVIVTDQDISPDIDPRGAWPEVGKWLHRQHKLGATICTVCTGAVLLASSGLLDGEEATTHWSAVGMIHEFFPKISLKPDRILQPAGPEHRIITAGGASAWQDLLLYLVARYAGEAEARRTAKIYLLGDRSEGQLPFAAMMPPKQHTDAIIQKCQEWVAANYHDASPVARMTQISGLSQRTFKRRFKAATGYGPIEYVQSLRIEEAKQMLETTGIPTDRVGREVGYEEPAFFRRLFKRKTGTTPARYRQRFSMMARPIA